MMARRFTLDFAADNAAFDADYGRRTEIAVILRNIARAVVNGADEGPVMDSNGNRVGGWALDDQGDDS